MDAAAQVIIPSEPSGSCNCRHFRVPEACIWEKSEATAAFVSELPGALKQEPPLYGARRSCNSSERVIGIL
eukprot:117088-Pyramimonas_sp.AAC.1